MSLKIVLLGAPGAGKGTQAQRLAQAHGLPHISTGDIFRAHLKQGTDVGKQVQQYLDSGRLVPDELTCRIVADRLAEPDCADGYILDGFPRSVPQAEELERILNARGEKLDLAIDIAVDDNEIVERLTARRTCPTCGAIYNMKFSPPKDGENCDKDGAKLVQRDDDKEETVRERLRVYHKTTKPIIGFYRDKGILKSVEGTGATPDQVFGEIESIIAEAVA